MKDLQPSRHPSYRYVLVPVKHHIVVSKPGCGNIESSIVPGAMIGANTGNLTKAISIDGNVADSEFMCDPLSSGCSASLEAQRRSLGDVPVTNLH
jgi:hypothetical protein